MPELLACNGRNANPDRYLVSLAEGVIELDVTFELSHTSNLYYR